MNPVWDGIQMTVQDLAICHVPWLGNSILSKDDFRDDFHDDDVVKVKTYPKLAFPNCQNSIFSDEIILNSAFLSSPVFVLKLPWLQNEPGTIV